MTTSAGEDRGTIFAQFRSPEGEALGPQLEVPLNLSPKQLNGVLNELLSNDKTDPYSFYVNDEVGALSFCFAYLTMYANMWMWCVCECLVFETLAEAHECC